MRFSVVFSQVYLGQDGRVDVYANTTIHPNSPINSDLLLDQNGAYIYIMTKTAVSPHRVQWENKKEALISFNNSTDVQAAVGFLGSRSIQRLAQMSPYMWLKTVIHHSSPNLLFV